MSWISCLSILPIRSAALEVNETVILARHFLAIQQCTVILNLKKIKPASISHEKYQYWTHTCLIRCTNKSRQLLNPLLISVGLLFAMVGNEIGTLFSIRQNFHFYSISPITATDLGGKKKNQSYNEIIYLFQYIKDIWS